MTEITLSSGLYWFIGCCVALLYYGLALISIDLTKIRRALENDEIKQ